MSVPGAGHVATLLGAWALDACDGAEAGAVAAHLRACTLCADEAALLRSAAAALSESGLAAGTHYPDLAPRRAGVLAAAGTRRRPAPAVPNFAAPFAATAGLLESVLAEVDDRAWNRRSVVHTWTAGDLVAHLAASDALVAAAIGLDPDPPVEPGQDVLAYSEAFIAVARAWPPRRVLSHWRAGVDAIAARLCARPEVAEQVVDIGATHMSVANQLIIRAFETWIHARDIGEVAGVRVPAPSDRHLRPMTELAAKVLDTLPRLGIFSSTGHPGPVGAVQLTLTGRGGGSWLVRIGTQAPPPAVPDAEIVVDAVEFCLLVAERRGADELGAVVTGAAELAAELFALAPILAQP